MKLEELKLDQTYIIGCKFIKVSDFKPTSGGFIKCKYLKTHGVTRILPDTLEIPDEKQLRKEIKKQQLLISRCLENLVLLNNTLRVQHKISLELESYLEQIKKEII